MSATGQKFSYQEQLKRYEMAQHILCLMMGIRTDAICAEEKKAVPDAVRITQLNQEFDQLDTELHALRLDDDVAIERVLDEYSPIIKADFERHRTAS